MLTAKKGGYSIGSQTSRQSGYSLFEVMIAIVVTSIGLLGLAAIQATGLKNNQSAYHRSQATVLAYDIADRMRANASSIDNYLTSFMTLTAATATGAQAGCKNTTGCSTAQMAQNDLLDWNAALTAVLPVPTGTITIDDRGTITVDDDVYTISVNWDDNRDGVVDDVDNDMGNDAIYDPNFQMSFQP